MAGQYPLPSGGSADTSGAGGSSYPLPDGGVWATAVPDETEALTGIAAAASIGTMTGESGNTLTGLAAAVSQGSMQGGQSGALSGVQASVSLGTMTVSLGPLQEALSGVEVGTRLGTMVPVVTETVLWPLEWTQPAYRQAVIGSYLYIQYNDDEDLLEMVQAYNDLSQQIIDWFVALNLPIYTQDPISGDLLDWVAMGVYGQARPVLPAGTSRDLGPLNTYAFNVLGPNMRRTIGPSEYFATTDDVFRRVITWNFYKGDGRTFDVRWLKRRVMRFLLGANGTDPGIDQTYQVSVTFGVAGEVTIRLVSGVRNIVRAAIPNTFALNTLTPNQIDTTWTQYAPLANAQIFKAAVDAGVLQLPFQFTWTVVIV